MVSKKNDKTSGQEFDEFLINLGENLKKYRTKNGYTSYEQFAFEHNIGRAQYGKYERGTEDMRLSSLFKVLKELNVPWDEFFKEMK
jgi:transcriptional regulator with XRE-family HTH domain